MASSSPDKQRICLCSLDCNNVDRRAGTLKNLIEQFIPFMKQVKLSDKEKITVEVENVFTTELPKDNAFHYITLQVCKQSKL
jgi:hypothetical protein